MSKSHPAKVDSRFLKEEGYEVFTGNELLVKGLLETEGGTHLWTGYPGSPVAGFFDCIEAIRDLPKHYGIRAVLANNEALSAAMVNGSQMLGLRAITVMKSVGVHVASDALALGNLAGAHPDGGALVVLGDDPWSDSTQVPADSRFLCKHLHMPVLEPSTPQELKDWIDVGFKLSRESELFIGYLVTTNQADGGGSVQVRRNHFPRVNTQNPVALDTSKVDLESKVLLPPRTWRKEQELPPRYARLWKSAERYGLDRLTLPPDDAARRPKNGRYALGFITSAMAATYLENALEELGLAEAVPILKFGITYPINPRQIERFAEVAEQFVVVEERRPFLEEEVTRTLNQLGIARRVWGKRFPSDMLGIPEDRGLNVSLLIERLAPLLLQANDPLAPVRPDLVERELALIRQTAAVQVQLVSRTPTFCPGCPHRDSASVLVEVKKDFRDPGYMRKKHRREPVDLLFHGDTGCYTMLMFEPTKDLMHNYSGMGLGGGTGLGIDAFITNKQVVFMGDSTFFHSGQIAISNSVKNGQDITYIILDNKTTAMTGHQTTPGQETDLLGNPTFAQSIDHIVSAMTETAGVEVVRVNPGYREQYRALLEEVILKDGVKVLIADKECGITYHRRQNREERKETRQRGYVHKKQFINITPDVCENCLECTLATGCPGLTFTETDFGRKVQTDLSWCVSDTACTKIYACPSFEEITIVRHQRPSPRLEALDLENLPIPQPRKFDGVWRAFLAGVGGMGIASSTATLVRAGHREGYTVLFCDKNGLAIRNGGVFSHLTYLKPQHPHVCPVIPYGKADLILGIDPLEAARSLDPSTNQRVGSPERTAAILNLVKTPTIMTLLGREDFCLETVAETVRTHTDASRYFGHNIAAASEFYFGTKLYANVIMLGVAWQRGELPLSLESLEWAIKETMGAAATDNWKAFNLGRYLVTHHEEMALRPKPTYREVLSEKIELLRAQGGRGISLANQFHHLATRAIEPLPLDADTLRLLALRIYDLLLYEDASFAQRYIDVVHSVWRRDTAQFGFAATCAVVWNAHRVMAIKDEVWVAHLLTSKEKYRRDQERYNVDPERGDHIEYRHLNRPEFEIGGRRIRFKIRSRDWMLQIMRRAKFLRRLLPRWHHRERAFRDWYLVLADEFRFSSDTDYHRWVEALRVPESATGYRDVRYPKMDAAMRRAHELIGRSSSNPSTP
jgi:indolepyruvate ferredoxin oxidoreductase